jgi:hypothetical protein
MMILRYLKSGKCGYPKDPFPGKPVVVKAYNPGD